MSATILSDDTHSVAIETCIPLLYTQVVNWKCCCLFESQKATTFIDDTPGNNIGIVSWPTQYIRANLPRFSVFIEIPNTATKNARIRL